MLNDQLNDQERAAWAGIERRLGEAPGAGVSWCVTEAGWAATRRWFPYLTAVVVPLLLPAISVAEIHPLVARGAAVVAVMVVLGRRLQRGPQDGHGTCAAGVGSLPGHRSQR
jgi:hypothetical protein